MALDDADTVSAHTPWPDRPPSLDELLRPPSWHSDASCKEPHPGVSFFPERGQSADPAKAVCAQCLVLSECQAWILAQAVGISGVWGGLSHRERLRIDRTPHEPADPAPCVDCGAAETVARGRCTHCYRRAARTGRITVTPRPRRSA